MRTHGAVVGRRFRSVTKLTTKVRIGRGYLWGSFLIAAAALKTPTRNGYNAQGVYLNFCVCSGTLSVVEALKTVSIETVVATKDNAAGKAGMLALSKADCNCVATLI